MDNTQNYEAVALINADEYVLTYRGRRAHTIARQSEEVIIQQWVNPHLFSDDCKQREDLYAYVSKNNPNLARLIAYDFQHGRYVYESFSCSLAQYNRFLEDGSPVWEQTWRDALLALSQLHNSYLNHGNLTVNSFYFRKDGQLKIVGIFPNFNDDFKYNIDAPPQGRSFLEKEFQKDIAALCSIFLSDPYRHLISQADQDDCAKLSKGELTLESALQLAEKRFTEITKSREEKDIKARKRALEEKENLEKQYRKGPGFVFVSIVCAFIVLGVIGVKYALDQANKENAPDLLSRTNPNSASNLNLELQQEADKKSREAVGDDGIRHTPEVLPGREIPAELTRAPVLSDEPEKKFFVGYVVKKLGTQIKVLNRNQQVSITFIIDDVDTQIRYADGTSRLLSDIRIGQEIEVEYEQGNEDENAYAHVIRLND